MKDRLEELKQRAKETESKERATGGTGAASEEFTMKQQAIVFEKEPVVETVLNNAQHIQDDIQELDEDVKKFSQQQKGLISSMRRFSVIKKESNITRDIKIRAENIHKRLEALSLDIKRAEAEDEYDSAITRIKCTQYNMLFKHFQNVMFQYNDSLTEKQDKCKQFIVRQLEVAGKDVTDEEVNRMMEQGKWEVFNENLLEDVKITKAQLSEIEQRHKELLNLESQIKDLRDLFTEIYLQVELQSGTLNNIEAIVNETKDYVEKSNNEIKLAVKYRQRNPCKVLFCCCCPCCD
ncbi:syntaxin-19 [Erpetoichthys calabaricus]|uniref:Syntaxin 19 n=1 Tax=Erpetoichthys calabaricus TaxID=27687 RepID=A0A8C4RP24_ERPCA|nr:syntaxin-19 [Erpetoichthys calabaricus]